MSIASDLVHKKMADMLYLPCRYFEWKPDRSTTLRLGLSAKLNARIGDNAKPISGLRSGRLREAIGLE